MCVTRLVTFGFVIWSALLVMELGEFQLDICLAIYYVPTVLCFQIANEDLKRVFLSRGSANIRGFGSVFLR